MSSLGRPTDRHEDVAAYTGPGMTCPECGALAGHWKPCSNASPELQKKWAAEYQTRLWHIIGCAEAYFDADTDDERAMAEAEFDRLLNAARATVTT